MPGATRILMGPSRTMELALPFAFDVYGASFSSMWVDAQGLLDFGGRGGTISSLPSLTAPRPAIVAFGWPLRLANARVCMTNATTTGSRVTVEFLDAELDLTSGNALTFEIVLTQGTGVVDLLYRDVEGSFASGLYATVGIQDATGTVATVYAHRVGGTIYDGLGLRFTPVRP